MDLARCGLAAPVRVASAAVRLFDARAIWSCVRRLAFSADRPELSFFSFSTDSSRSDRSCFLLSRLSLAERRLARTRSHFFSSVVLPAGIWTEALRFLWGPDVLEVDKEEEEVVDAESGGATAGATAAPNSPPISPLSGLELDIDMELRRDLVMINLVEQWIDM